jgi:hypothetical protein
MEIGSRVETRQLSRREGQLMTAWSTRHFRELGRYRSHRSGSRRRLMKIRFRGNWSPEAILFLLSMLFILAVIVPWLAGHAPDDVSVSERPALGVPH